jgi:transposase
VEVAGALLVAAGDNPARLSDEAAFAAMCGVSPVDASSVRQQRHRLNRGGNRDANRALWVVALERLRSEPRTRADVERRTSQGLSKREILRCLKRYIARDAPLTSGPHTEKPGDHRDVTSAKTGKARRGVSRLCGAVQSF